MGRCIHTMINGWHAPQFVYVLWLPYVHVAQLSFMHDKSIYVARLGESWNGARIISCLVVVGKVWNHVCSEVHYTPLKAGVYCPVLYLTLNLDKI